MSENRDTLNETFSKFFGPTEDTAGTGTVRRVDEYGIMHQVVVDEAERAAWLAKCEAESRAHGDESLARALAQADDC